MRVRHRMRRALGAAVASALVVGLLAGCATTTPPPSDEPLPSAVLPTPDLTPVPGAASISTVGGTVACERVEICKPVMAALEGMIPEPLPTDQVLVITPGCPTGDDCLAGIHALAVLVPATWKLGDSLTAAWTVQGIEGSLLVKPWIGGSLPEEVLPVVRAAVEAG